MPALDAIRDAGERDYAAALAELDADSRRELRAALREYGAVDRIPRDVWDRIVKRTEEQTVALILLVMLGADGWATGRIVGQGAPERRVGEAGVAGYGLTAAGRAQRSALRTTDTLRSRLRREIENARLGDRGDLGELTDDGIDEALDKVLTPERREGIAADETTGAISAGTMGARDRYYEPGAGGTIEIDLIWRTEGDNLVCPRCSPLNGTTEDVWGRVFPDGPGESAHPNCRCELEPKVRPKEPTE